jgi:hypothetical protein
MAFRSPYPEQRARFSVPAIMLIALSILAITAMAPKVWPWASHLWIVPHSTASMTWGSSVNSLADERVQTRTFDDALDHIESVGQLAGRRAGSRLRWLTRQISRRADWDAMAMCESSQRWHLNVGIFDGGLQFLPSTWDAYGGGQFARWAWQASKLEQIVVASRVLAVQGPIAWPHCFRSA